MICRAALSFLAILLWAPSPASASDAPPVESPAGLFLESISVEGLRRASPDLILAESRLKTGRVYTEAELRQAAARVQRLPFVLDARFSLRKGSRRGAYELVITVREIARFFLGHEVRHHSFGRPLALTQTSPQRSSTTVSAAVGIRHFVGTGGVAFASLSGSDAYELGYTHYDLFGRGVFATLTYGRRGSGTVRIFPIGVDPSFSNWDLDRAERFSLSFGLPLDARRSLHLTLSDLDGTGGERHTVLPPEGPSRQSFDLETARYRRAELRWIDDTTDDPVLPESGHLLSGWFSLERLESRQDRLFFPLPSDPQMSGVEREDLPRLASRFMGLGASARRHWPVGARGGVSAEATAFVGRSAVENLPRVEPDVGGVIPEESLTSFQGSLRGTGSLRLLGRGRSRELGDFRLVLEVEYAYETLSPGLRLPNAPLERLESGISLVFRNRWGVFRFGFTWVDVGEILR